MRRNDTRLHGKPPGNWPMPTLTGASAYGVQVASVEPFDKTTALQDIT